MTTSVWQDAWNIRIDVLDTEHRELLEMLNALAVRFARDPDSQGQRRAAGRLSQTTVDGRDDTVEHDALIAALERLAARAREHFRHEDDFMRTIDYPDLGAHRSEHALLLAEYVEMVRSLKSQSITRLDPQTVTALRQWLVAHMLDADKEYADHYFAVLEKKDKLGG